MIMYISVGLYSINFVMQRIQQEISELVKKAEELQGTILISAHYNSTNNSW